MKTNYKKLITPSIKKEFEKVFNLFKEQLKEIDNVNLVVYNGNIDIELRCGKLSGNQYAVSLYCIECGTKRILACSDLSTTINEVFKTLKEV